VGCLRHPRTRVHAMYISVLTNVFILCSGFLKAKPKSLANKGLSDAQRAAAQVFACARRTWCACGVLFREWISAGWSLGLDTCGTGKG
jgi:hypothetical protein